VKRARRHVQAVCALSVLLLGCQPSPAAADQAFTYPIVELDERLREIFTVSGCQYISGLTCRIHYNGSAALPTEVFFIEFGGDGKRLGKRTRLIYPKLEKGESGAATFRIKTSSPARIRLEASGNGPWKNPY